MKKNILSKSFLFSTLFVFLIMLIFNFLTPYIADDWSYASAKSISDIFKQEYSHYFTTNGRSVAHTIAQFFLMYDKFFFNIMNAAVYIVFTGLIFIHAVYGLRLKRNEALICWLLIHFLVFLYVVNWGQVFLWLDGSCNYLWTGTIVLSYLLPFRVYFSNQEKFSKSYLLPIMCVGGAISGWCNENTSGGIILLSILFIIIFGIMKIKLQKWMFGGVICSIVTYSLMIMSPGNAHRLTYFVDNRAWYNRLISRFQSVTNNIYGNYRYLLFAIAVMVAIAIFLHLAKKYWTFYGIYLFTSVAIFYSLILSPVANGRPFFGGSIFLIIVCTGIFANIINKKTEIFCSAIGYALVLSVICFVDFINAGIDLTYFKIHSDRRDEYVQELRNAGYKNIVVNEISPKPSTKYNAANGLSDLMNNPHEWPSTAYARYYNLDTVTTVPYEVFNRIFRDGAPELNNCRDIYDYLELIKNPRYTIFMAVNDDSSGAINSDILEKLSSLGLKTDLGQGFRWSYIAVIHKGDVLYEMHDNKLLNFYQNIDGNTVEIISSGKIYNKGNIASIKINGYEYAKNVIGLNIVVYDNSKGKVVDRVTFNTWDDLEATR